MMEVYKKHAGMIKLIISLCPGLNCYFVYDINGILLKKVSFEYEASLYGKPVQVSENGKNLIFQKDDDLFNVHVLCINSKRLVYIKSIDIKASINQYLIDIENEAVFGSKEHEMIQEQKSRIKGDFQTLFIPSNVVLTFSINDNLDVTIQISNMLEKQLNHELLQLFCSEDIPTLINIYKLKN